MSLFDINIFLKMEIYNFNINFDYTMYNEQNMRNQRLSGSGYPQ